MAKLKINSDIVSEDERQFLKLWLGIDSGISYDSIETFLDSIAEDDNQIDISIHCRGGEVMEGWSIYDKLRASGKEISATIEGKCASMASILLLAAPQERRYGRPNASLLIHDPYMCYVDGHLTAEELNKLSENMQSETDKIVDCYVERTGADETTIRALMKEDKFIDMEQAKELGFISTIVAPITAIKTESTNNKTFNIKQMKEEVKVPKSFLDKILAFTKTKSIAEAEKKLIVAMELTTQEGTTLTVEREEGDPQVGDKASPDGTHSMPDGKTIVVEGGEITEIIEAATETNAETEALKAEVESLKEQLNALKTNAISDTERDILNKVKEIGIDKLKAMSSNYVPAARVQSQSALDSKEPVAKRSSVEERLEKIKNQS